MDGGEWTSVGGMEAVAVHESDGVVVEELAGSFGGCVGEPKQRSREERSRPGGKRNGDEARCDGKSVVR